MNCGLGGSDPSLGEYDTQIPKSRISKGCFHAYPPLLPQVNCWSVFRLPFKAPVRARKVFSDGPPTTLGKRLRLPGQNGHNAQASV